jgi:hypothetical protein
VALKSVVDAFSMYAVEACLLKQLPNVFPPRIAYDLEDATVTRIAGESEECTLEREDLVTKERVLEKSMITLRRLKSFTGPSEY